MARFAAQLRRGEIVRPPVAPPGSTTPARTTLARPLSTHWSPRRVAGLYAFSREALTEARQASLTQLRRADATADASYRLAQAFATMLRQRQGEQLDAWLGAADASGVAELQRCARGLVADKAAVQAGLTLCWSQGQVEGQIHRLKLVKRSRYGRAGCALLRRRVFTAA